MKTNITLSHIFVKIINYFYHIILKFSSSIFLEIDFKIKKNYYIFIVYFHRYIEYSPISITFDNTLDN